MRVGIVDADLFIGLDVYDRMDRLPLDVDIPSKVGVGRARVIDPRSRQKDASAFAHPEAVGFPDANDRAEARMIRTVEFRVSRLLVRSESIKGSFDVDQ